MPPTICDREHRVWCRRGKCVPSTVRGDSVSRWAISGVLSPAATRVAISRSLALSGSGCAAATEPGSESHRRRRRSGRRWPRLRWRCADRHGPGTSRRPGPPRRQPTAAPRFARIARPPRLRPPRRSRAVPSHRRRARAPGDRRRGRRRRSDAAGTCGPRIGPRRAEPAFRPPAGRPGRPLRRHPSPPRWRR